MKNQDQQFKASLKRIVLGATLLFGAVYAQAVTPPVPGLERAEKVCAGIGFASDVLTCVRTVKSAQFYNPEAVQLCSEQNFTSEKQKCLETIRDLEYSATSIETCRAMHFHSKILECLKETGRTYVAPAPVITAQAVMSTAPRPNRTARREVRHALRALRNGNVRNAERILEDLLAELREE